MSAKKFLPKFLIALLIAKTLNAQQIEFHFINVGQGDAFFAKIDTLEFVIDAGNANDGNNIIKPYLLNLGITKLDFTIASHHHADHIGGLDEIINYFNPEICYDRGGAYNSTQFNQYASSAGPRRRTPQPGDTLYFNPQLALVKCYAVNGYILNYGYAGTSDENTLSIAILISTWNQQGDTFKLFTAGDLYQKQETLITKYNPISAHITKINHHGSRSSTAPAFINSLKPTAVIIPVGDNNPYGHPHQETLLTLNRTESVKFIYQTETGANTSPKSIIAGNVKIKVSLNPKPAYFTISTSSGRTDTFYIKDNTLNITPQPFDTTKEKTRGGNTMQVIVKENSIETIFNEPVYLKSIHIFNILGQKIQTTDFMSWGKEFKIPFQNNASGIYLIIAETSIGLIKNKISIVK